ncbi:MAG: mycothiol transferase [Mycobacterium sp.]|nr:mycothiol transferase [Mycobacterium sp.]
MSDTAAARELLRDSFTRLIEHVDEISDGLTEDVSCWRPTPEANSIAWLLWHSARCQDLQLCEIAGIEQVWTSEGWIDRFALDLPRPGDEDFNVAKDIGYGHSAEDVGKVRPPVELLIGYYRAVHKVTLEYVATVTPEELDRVIDERWDPPVTATVRLVSIIDDCAQHLGQAAYVRGIAAHR